MSSLVESAISFGSYTFPFGSWVKVREGSTDIDESPMLGLDGTIAPAGVLKAQTLSVEIPIGGDGSWDPKSTSGDIIYLITMDDLNNAANDLFAQLEQGYQALNVGYTPARTINAQKRKFEIPYSEATGRRNAAISIEFYAPDPRWLAEVVQTITSSGTATNNGNMISYPIVTYQQSGGAASAQPTLKVDTGAGHVELTLNITLQDGDELVIDCDPRQRANGIVYTPSGGNPTPDLALLGTTGIVNTIGNDATFPYLLPGTHNVNFGGANSISFAWNDAYAL